MARQVISRTTASRAVSSRHRPSDSPLIFPPHPPPRAAHTAPPSVRTAMAEPLRWNSVSPTTGQSLKWGQKGATWNGHWPESSKPKRRISITIHDLNLPANMLSFRYIVYLIKGIFTAKPSLRPAMSEGDYLDTLATRAALTRPQVEALITAQAALHVELARQGIPVDFILKRFRVVPSCGGRYTGPDPDNADVCATLAFSLVVHPDEIDKMRVGCPLEKTGESGELGPVVESVRSRPGNLLSKYGVGTTGGTEVNGRDFRESRSDAEWPTAALVPVAGGAAIPLGVLDCTPTRLILSGAPAGTTGAHFLKITDASDHFTTYDEELTAA